MTEPYIEIKPQKTFAEIGLDPFGQAPLKFAGSEVNQKARPIGETATPAPAIQSGDMTQNFTMTAGWMQSENFVTGISGWILRADGTYEFN